MSVSMPGPRRVEPCVLHFAGLARLRMGDVYCRVMSSAWVPWQTNFSKFRRYLNKACARPLALGAGATTSSTTVRLQ